MSASRATAPMRTAAPRKIDVGSVRHERLHRDTLVRLGGKEQRRRSVEVACINACALGRETTRRSRPALPPRYFAYRVSDFTNIFRYLTDGAEGQWWFEEAGASTEVKWTYSFHARSTLAKAMLLPTVKLLWNGYMRVGIQAIGAVLIPTPVSCGKQCPISPIASVSPFDYLRCGLASNWRL